MKTKRKEVQSTTNISTLQMEMISILVNMWKAYTENRFFNEEARQKFHVETQKEDCDKAYKNYTEGTVEEQLSKLLLTIMGCADHFDVKLSTEYRFGPSVSKLNDFGENCCSIINYITSGLFERTEYDAVLNILLTDILKLCRIYELDIYDFICAGKYEFNFMNSLVIKAELLQISEKIDEDRKNKGKTNGKHD